MWVWDGINPTRAMRSVGGQAIVERSGDIGELRWIPEPSILPEVVEGAKRSLSGWKKRLSAIREMGLGLFELRYDTGSPGPWAIALGDLLRKGGAGEVVLDRVEVWLPLVDLHAPPNARATFEYDETAIGEGGAEISLLNSTFGKSGKVSLSRTFKLDAEQAGKQLRLKMLASVVQYRASDGGELFNRLDIESASNPLQYEVEDVYTPAGLTSGGADPQRWDLVERVNLSASHDIGRYVWSYKTSGALAWSVGLDLKAKEVPILRDTGFKLTLRCERSETFKTTFELPYGRDYGFYRPLGERPPVPVGVAMQ